MKKPRNSRFANYVTSMAFNISLSKAMIVVMAQIGSEVRKHDTSSFWAVGAPDTAVPSLRCLIERGLIYAPNPDLPGICVFTEAGKHVFELLKISGLIAQLKDACNDYDTVQKRKKS